MNSGQENLGQHTKDKAVFLPAISNFYNTFISKQRVTEGTHIPKERIPDGFDRGVEGLNFLNPEQGYFTYPTALYSAGHACLDMDKVNDRDSMVKKNGRE